MKKLQPPGLFTKLGELGNNMLAMRNAADGSDIQAVIPAGTVIVSKPLDMLADVMKGPSKSPSMLPVFGRN